MKDNTDYNDIRRLIARWYEADTGRDEEEALVSFLSSADSLPPDIEKDKELILGLYIPEPEYQDMPEEYSIRISEALETEISKEKVEKEWNRKSIFKIPGSRRMGWAAAVGAVVLLGSVTVLKLKDAPDMKTAVSKSMNIALPSQEEDTLPKQRNLILSSTDKKLIASAASAMKEGKLRSAEKSEYKKINKKESGGESSLSLEDWNSTGNDEYDYTEEEERLARSNYRVVRSEEEAEAMLNSIYSRLENNLERETNKISRYELEYESSMVKLSEINNVTLLKEKYHEQTPL